MRSLRILFTCFLLLSLAACSTLPQRDKTPLVKTDNYSEEFIPNVQHMQLFVRIWEPQEAAHGNIIILHGTTLHGGLYKTVAERLSATGYRVLALDMQGWGRSEGKGDSGYVDSFDDYANDLYLMVRILKERYPAAPNYVMGESLGGAVAMYSALRRQDLFDGVITSAVGFKPNLKLLGMRAPGFLNDMAMTTAKWGTSLFPSFPAIDSDLGLRYTVEDAVVQEQMLNDPYVSHGYLPGAYISTLVEASDFIEANMQYFDKPLLLLHGSEDVLVPVSSSQELMDAVASKHKEMHVYRSPHAVLLERASVEAVSDVINFLENTDKQAVASNHSL